MKPILFNTEMVRAILDGRKTVTRRVVKPQPDRVYSGGNVELRCHTDGPHKDEWHCYRELPPLDKVVNSPWGGQIKPPYQIGDILYVRETWNINNLDYENNRLGIIYKASKNIMDSFRWILVSDSIFDKYEKTVAASNYAVWRPSIHMPKEAARLFLRVVDVRAERLRDITNTDAEREGALTEERLRIEEEAGVVGLPVYPLREYFGRYIWDRTIKVKDMPLYGWEANPYVWVIKFERCEIDVK